MGALYGETLVSTDPYTSGRTSNPPTENSICGLLSPSLTRSSAKFYVKYAGSKRFVLYFPQSKRRSSTYADKPARRVQRSVKVTKHSTIPYVRYSFLLSNSNFVFKTRRFSDIRLQKMS